MSVTEKLQLVQSLFQETQQRIKDNSVESVLKQYDGEFLSIVYEAIAVHLATLDLKLEDNSFSLWNNFLIKHGALHGSQIHVGLGWALSEMNVTDISILPSFTSTWRWRVLDGYGYHSGLFKRREAIRSQQVPPFIIQEDIHAFNQGIGRSLWYTSKGDIERLLRSLNLFDLNRQKGLWRGVGLATSYVGGVDKSTLNNFLNASGVFAPQLKCGIIMAIAARKKSGILSTDTNFLSTSLSLENHYAIDLIFSTSNSYYELIEQIEATL